MLWTLGCMSFSDYGFSRIFQGVLLGLMDSIFSFLRKSSLLFSIVSVPIYIPTNSGKIPYYPHPQLLFVHFLMMAILTLVRSTTFFYLFCFSVVSDEVASFLVFVDHVFVFCLFIFRTSAFSFFAIEHQLFVYFGD